MSVGNEYIIGFIVSFIANFLSALAGGGSGLFLLPALLFMGIPYPIALTSHKIATVGLGVGAAFRHSFVKSLNKKFIVGLTFLGLPGVYIGARLAIFIPEDYAKLALGILILSIAAIQFFCETRPLKEQTDDLPVQKHVFGGLGFFVIAMLNGSLTSGTGLLFTMWLVYWYRQPFVLSLSYTMIVCSLFYNATGAVVLSSDVSISLPFVTSLVLGAIIGGFCGASFSLKKGELFIKKIFVASCTLLGAVLVCQSLHGLF